MIAEHVIVVTPENISLWEYLATDQTVAVLWGLLVGLVMVWIALESGLLDEGLIFGLVVCLVPAVIFLLLSYGAVFLLWKADPMLEIALLLTALVVFLAVVAIVVALNRRATAMTYDPKAMWDGDNYLMMSWLEEEARQQEALGFDGEAYLRERAAAMGITHLIWDDPRR